MPSTAASASPKRRDGCGAPGSVARGVRAGLGSLAGLGSFAGFAGLGALAGLGPFGSFAGFKAQLTKAAATTQGSGWGVLAYEPLSGRLIVEQVYDHQGNVGQGSTPILVFDAWEHAFYLQYKNVKADFFTALWNVFNWDDVARRLAAAREAASPLSM